MKSGLMNFSGNTQGGRSNESCKYGEDFISSVLEVLGIRKMSFWNSLSDSNRELKELHPDNFLLIKPIDESVTQVMKPDFIIKKTNGEILFLESKFKQIAGSDWEKLESNWGYHEHYYKELCGLDNERTVVILVGFWQLLQPSVYPNLVKYAKDKFGSDCLFDFGASIQDLSQCKNYERVKDKIKRNASFNFELSAGMSEIERFAKFIGIEEITSYQKDKIYNLWRDLHFKGLNEYISRLMNKNSN